MTPFHPLLRQALLTDKKHKRLTRALLDQYEALVAQLYDLESQEAGRVAQDRGTLRKKIKRFRDVFMPNFDKIRRAWAENQDRNIKGRYGPPKIKDLLIIPPAIIILWIAGIYGEKDAGIARGLVTAVPLIGLCIWWLRQKGVRVIGNIGFSRNLPKPRRPKFQRPPKLFKQSSVSEIAINGKNENAGN